MQINYSLLDDQVFIDFHLNEEEIDRLVKGKPIIHTTIINKCVHNILIQPKRKNDNIFTDI